MLDANGNSPLVLAINGDNEEAVQVLIDHKTIDLNFLNTSGRTPIFAALENGNHHIIRSLLRTGHINLTVEDPDGCTPALCAIRAGVHSSDLTEIILAGSDLQWDSDQASWRSLFFAAIEHDNLAAIQFFLATGRIDLNHTRTSDGLTPLEFAVHFQRCDAVSLLIKAGAYVTSKDATGNTPLFNTIISSDMKTACELLSAAPRLLLLENGRGETPLQFATRLKSPTHPFAVFLRGLESATNEREWQYCLDTARE